jgi:DNA repair protein RadC
MARRGAQSGSAPHPGLDDAAISPIEAAKPHYLGHRQRLRERLLEAGAASLPDYELLEFLLFAAMPRGDAKPLAKELLHHFGGFAEVLNAEKEALLAVPGIGDAAAAALLAAREAGLRLSRAALRERPLLGSWQKLIEYCTATVGFAPVEEFRLLFLDHHNRLIADERQQRGTINHTPVYPREVMKRALEIGASALILVHNHPSGDPTPSRADIEMTREIVKAAALFNVAVHDHVIIARDRHSSLKTLGLF